MKLNVLNEQDHSKIAHMKLVTNCEHFNKVELETSARFGRVIRLLTVIKLGTVKVYETNSKYRIGNKSAGISGMCKSFEQNGPAIYNINSDLLHFDIIFIIHDKRGISSIHLGIFFSI